MQKIKNFTKKHFFFILLSIFGIILTGLFGLITGAIAGTLLDQLVFRMKNRETETEAENYEYDKIEPKSVGNTEDYLILGIRPDTNPIEIKKVYHKLAAQFHPDLATNLSPEQRLSSEEAFKKIKSAYERVIGG